MNIHSIAFYDADKNIILFRILHWCGIYFTLYIVKEFVAKWREIEVQRRLCWSIIFGLIVGWVFLFVWPGTWSWDDVFIYTSALNYDLYPWQHFLTSIFHIMSLQLIPLAGGVVCVQICIASLIAGECIVSVVECIELRGIKRVVAEILLLVSMLSLPVVTYLFSGFRMGIYSYLELLYLSKIFCFMRREKCITKKELIFIIILTVLVSSWRTEGIFYLVILPIIIYMLYQKRSITKKQGIGVIVSAILLTLFINGYNNKLIGDNDYSITATIVPVVAILRDERAQLTQEELEELERVINLDVVKQNEIFKAEELFYMGLVRDNYTKQEYYNYLKTYAKIIMKNPDTALQSMKEIFLQTAGVKFIDNRTLQRTVVVNTAGGTLRLYDNHTMHSRSFLQMKIPMKYPIISEESRNNAILKMACINSDGTVRPFYYVCWNLIIPLILVMICIIGTIVKRNKILFIILTSIVIRALILFFTSCAPYIMYYISVYLLAYFWSFVFIFETIPSEECMNMKCKNEWS